MNMTKSCWFFHCYHIDSEIKVKDFDVSFKWCQRKPNTNSICYYETECCRCGKRNVKTV